MNHPGKIKARIFWPVSIALMVCAIYAFFYFPHSTYSGSSKRSDLYDLRSSVGAGKGDKAKSLFGLAASSPYLKDAVFLKNGLLQTDIKGGPLISINFDDGYQSIYDKALPILQKYNFRSTQYIATGFINVRGFMTEPEILQMASEGHEIAAHTRHHPNLTLLSPSEAQTEIAGSKADLNFIGLQNVYTFAYPYGDFNLFLEGLVKEDGYQGARITRPEFNDSSSDRFALLRQGVESNTPLSVVESAIEKAKKNKKWLILVFHRVDEAGNPESVSSQTLDQIFRYIKQSGVKVVTNAEALLALDKIQ